MERAIIHFANGEKLEVKQDDIFIGIHPSKQAEDDTYSASQNKVYTMWSHLDAGFTPSVLEMVFNSAYFHDADNEKVVYSTSSIVKIENIND